MQVHGGYNGFSGRRSDSVEHEFHNTPFGVPVFQFPNLSLGGQQNFPNYSWMKRYPMQAEMNWHAGKHEMKFGGEFLKDRHTKVLVT